MCGPPQMIIFISSPTELLIATPTNWAKRSKVMASRAAQRREKKKLKNNFSGTVKASKKFHSKSPTKKLSNKPIVSTKKLFVARSKFDSDSESENDPQENLYAPIPLESLEKAQVRDFTKENKEIKKSKRTRIEIERTKEEIKKKKIRQEKAQKIVWRKFERQNILFEQYYKQILQLKDEKEWNSFIDFLQRPPNVHIRVNGNYKSLSEIVIGTLETDFDLSNVTLKLASGEETTHVKLNPVEWESSSDQKKQIWKLSIDSKSFRKSKELQDLSNYFRIQGTMGTLLRQEPTTSIVPMFLNIQPGEKVLDLCGGGEHRAPMIAENLIAKTNQSKQDDECLFDGLLVVNEKESSAATIAQQNLSKTLGNKGLTIAVVTSHRPEEFPLLPDQMESGMFDHVICTAPCSGDGLIRKIPEKWRLWNPSNAWKFHGSQIALAEKALTLVKVGGRLLFSTKSLNPIENEAIVAEILRQGEGAYELEDLSNQMPLLKRHKGLATWQVFDEDLKPISSWKDHAKMRASMWPPTKEETNWMHLERTVRLLPHQNDTHGIFIAVIKKVKSSQRPAGPIIDPSCTTNQAKKALKKAAKILGTFLQAEKKNIQTVADFFGIEIGSITPITWSNWMERSSFGKEKDLYFVSTQVENFLSSYQGKLCVHKAGVHAFHRIPTANGSLSAASSSSFGYEITDEGVQTLLPFIHTRIVPLDMEEFEDLLKTKQVWLKNASPQLQEILFEMEQEGSIICVLNDLEPVQTGDRDLFVIANRRHNSFSIHSSSAKLAKIKALMNELNVPIDDDDEEEEEEEEEEDKNGYDSSSDVGAQYEDEDDV